MSDVSEAASVRLLLADYAAIDPGGRINAIGAGLNGLGINQTTGLTVGFALIVQVGVPPQLYDAECAVEILLEDASGGLVELPLVTGLPSQQAIRVGQAVRFDTPRLPVSVNVPRRYLHARAQWVLSFASGLPLVAGQGYGWRVKIDDATKDDWIERFIVVGTPTGPVVGLQVSASLPRAATSLLMFGHLAPCGLGHLATELLTGRLSTSSLFRGRQCPWKQSECSIT